MYNISANMAPVRFLYLNEVIRTQMVTVLFLVRWRQAGLFYHSAKQTEAKDRFMITATLVYVVQY